VNFQSVVAVLIALCALSGVVGKIVIDKDMTLHQGVPIAMVFALWGYVQVRIATGSGEHLQGIALVLEIVGVVAIGQFYLRNPPGRRKRQVKSSPLGAPQDSSRAGGESTKA